MENTENKESKETTGEKQVSISIFKKRWRKFKTLKRGYYSFIIIVIAYALSFILPGFVGRNALVVQYNGEYYFPLFKFYSAEQLGQKTDAYGEANYRILNREYKQADQGNWVLLPLYPYGPNENLLSEIEGNPPHSPSGQHWAGTDDRGRDVFARLLYGFNTGLSFALLVTILAYVIGIVTGAVLGFYGGKVDILGLRLIEVWSTLPFLYVVIIISSITQPNFFILVFILMLFGWIGITYYMRGEFYREKARDYVAAAVSMGAKNRTVIFKHILPNSLTPVISYAPFAIVANIFALVSLDYLGFGLPPPTPSWGQLMQQGLSNIEYWWLIITPIIAMFCTLLMITFIGEAIREAFDPKVYSRLR